MSTCLPRSTAARSSASTFNCRTCCTEPVLRAPVQDEKPEAIDDAAAGAVKGITRIVPLPYGVGIIGETVEATKRAKELLKVTWTNSSRIRNYTSDRLLEQYRSIGRDLTKIGVNAFAEGDAQAAISKATTVIEADYMSDHVYHCNDGAHECHSARDRRNRGNLGTDTGTNGHAGLCREGGRHHARQGQGEYDAAWWRLRTQG